VNDGSPHKGGPPHEMERLANRVALLVSADSEADNAGRAVGAMARRLGLSGGDLKAMFLAGAAASTGSATRTDAQRQAARLQDTVEQLEEGLRDAEQRLLRVGQQNQKLHEALQRAATLARRQRIAGAVALAVLLGGGILAWSGPASDGRATPSVTTGNPLAGTARVGGGGATLYADSDAHSAVLARLPPGAELLVRGLVWHSLNQWAQASVGGSSGYISASELVLP